MSTLHLYRIMPNNCLPIVPQAETFDELTRQLPQGFYTTFRTYDEGKRVLGLSAHLQRLYQPAISQKIEPDLSPANLRSEMATILQTHPGESRIRVILTGNGEIYLAMMRLLPLHQDVYQKGVKAITTVVQRKSPRLKSTLFITSSKDLRNQISGSDIFEALLLRNDVILEGMTSNFFYVKNGMLGTAQKNILLGVTRRTVLRVGRGIGLKIDYNPLPRKQIPALDEAFLTSSSRGIVPIIQIDNLRVGLGVPGTITKRLMEAYDAYVTHSTEVI